MKNILLTTLFILTSFLGFSQDFKKSDLPQFYTKNGDTIGVLLTIEQVQKLDNNSDLLSLFEGLSKKCDTIETYYVSVILNQNDKISLLEVKINNLNEQTLKQDDMVKTLKDEVSMKQNQLDISDQQLSNDIIIIKDLKKDLRKQKLKSLMGWSSMGAVSIIAIGLGIFFGTK